MLVNMKYLLDYAEKNRCAVGAFNCATLESARAAVTAAEILNVPIILQHASVHWKYISLELSGKAMLALAELSSVPVCVHLDHGSDYETIMKAIRLGFTSVMYDASAKPYEQNKLETKVITELAHHAGVTVEAELGNMPSNLDGSLGNYSHENYYTVPEMAAEFARDTGVDALAISFGTVHGLYTAEPKLSFDVIRMVRQATNDLPLVMHGGSGLTDEAYRRSISAGIRKINYYTYEALAGGKAVYEYVKANVENGALYHDIAAYATEKMTEDVLRVMRIFYGK